MSVARRRGARAVFPPGCRTDHGSAAGIWRLTCFLASGLRLDRLLRLTARCIRSIPGHFHAFLDNWGLLDDAIDGSSGPRRRLRRALRFLVRSVVRVIPWLRVGAFFLLSELLYHLGLLHDGVDVQRLWTRKTTLAVLPAVLGVVVAIGLGAGVAWTSPAKLATRYAELAQQAVNEHDHAAAALWLTRLVKLDSRQPAYRYELAVALEGQGLHDRAWALMQTMAPADRAGYPHAHFWLARQLCAQPKPTIGNLQTAWRHLTHVLQFNPRSEEAHALLARVLMSLGELDDAEKHLQQAAARDPEMRLLLAALYAREGKRQQAESVAKAAAADLSRQQPDESADPAAHESAPGRRQSAGRRL